MGRVSLSWKVFCPFKLCASVLGVAMMTAKDFTWIVCLMCSSCHSSTFSFWKLHMESNANKYFCSPARCWCVIIWNKSQNNVRHVNVLPATMKGTTQPIPNDFLLIFLVCKRTINIFTLSAPDSPYKELVHVVVLQMANGGQQNACTACRRPHIIIRRRRSTTNGWHRFPDW